MHTPGPWRECGEDRGGCTCRQVWSTSADVMVAVAVMAHDEHYTGGAGPADLGMAKANARLIAAAPDLLQACESALAVFATLDIIGGTPRKPRPIKDTLRAAIQKAKGA